MAGPGERELVEGGSEHGPTEQQRCFFLKQQLLGRLPENERTDRTELIVFMVPGRKAERVKSEGRVWKRRE